MIRAPDFAPDSTMIDFSANAPSRVLRRRNRHPAGGVPGARALVADPLANMFSSSDVFPQRDVQARREDCNCLAADGQRGVVSCFIDAITCARANGPPARSQPTAQIPLHSPHRFDKIHNRSKSFGGKMLPFLLASLGAAKGKRHLIVCALDFSSRQNSGIRSVR